MSNLVSIDQIADLAKRSGRLDSTRQWELADMLASLTDTQVSVVSAKSGRNESTLHQYARAAQRWPEADRVDGVSFSAHRVALSWMDPRQLLVDCKQKYGSPTVKEVRREMGLEGHPAIEALEKGINKIDRKVSSQALGQIITQLAAKIKELDPLTTDLPDEEEEEETLPEPDTDTTDTDTQEDEPEEDTQVESKGTWKPLINTSDIAGI